MEKLFRVRVSRDNVVGRELEQLTNSELRALGKTLSDNYPEMAVIPILVVPWSKHSSEQETDDYYSAKHALVSEHLSSQFVDRKHLDDRNSFKWSISNIGLGLFAKMGGVPWLVKPSTEKCLIVGIGQAHSIVDAKIERYVAYSVLSDSTGQYEAIRVLGDTHNQRQYLATLRANLKKVLIEHAGKFKSFVIHVTFSMKQDEINTIVDMLRELEDQEGNSHELIAVKFNDHNDFFGFSVEHNSLVPFEGTVARLSNREYVMWFSGLSSTRRGAQAPTTGSPSCPLSRNALTRGNPAADLARRNEYIRDELARLQREINADFVLREDDRGLLSALPGIGSARR